MLLVIDQDWTHGTPVAAGSKVPKEIRSGEVLVTRPGIRWHAASLSQRQPVGLESPGLCGQSGASVLTAWRRNHCRSSN